jgi:hypothetical protein
LESLSLGKLTNGLRHGGALLRGAYIRNGLSVTVSEYGGLIHRELVLGEGGGVYLEVYGISLSSNVSFFLAESYNSRQYINTLPESTDITLAILFVIDLRLYSQSEILSRRLYVFCMQE